MRTTTSACFLAAVLATAIDEPLRATLLQMARDDQESIRLSTANPNRELTKAESMQVSEMITRNHELIRKIVQEHGWPGRSLVGDDGAGAAWLVVQHMDMDVEFQRRCLSLMQEAFLSGEVSPRNLAYLTDRVLTHDGKKQMYGTQGMGVLSAEDEARVDRNRAELGLPPWRVAVEARKKEYANGYGGGAADAAAHP